MPKIVNKIFFLNCQMTIFGKKLQFVAIFWHSNGNFPGRVGCWSRLCNSVYLPKFSLMCSTLNLDLIFCLFIDVSFMCSTKPFIPLLLIFLFWSWLPILLAGTHCRALRVGLAEPKCTERPKSDIPDTSVWFIFVLILSHRRKKNCFFGY